MLWGAMTWTMTKTTSKPSPFVAARRKKRLKRTELAQRLHIDVKVLKSFDEWSFEDLPELNEPLYVLLRRYARVLEISPSAWERQLPPEYQQNAKPFKSPRSLFFLSRAGYVTGVIIVVIAFMGFLGWRTIRANAIPELTVFSPEQNAIVEESRFEITGTTNEGAQVFINGVTVPVETDGTFTGSAILQTGPNTIEIRAINSFAREKTIERVVIREPATP